MNSAVMFCILRKSIIRVSIARTSSLRADRQQVGDRIDDDDVGPKLLDGAVHERPDAFPGRSATGDRRETARQPASTQA